ncbi:hypothetical protein GGX14DRAFT_578330 [Mycena pura]|uniref:Uncharacterized protein n=1 Tax=Mycena pura TaxID=153505 RepID=A0AAD6UQB3_9AGAR|nr:hypothetical protein GGX14DRAFT_578330 [Mycena pura]
MLNTLFIASFGLYKSISRRSRDDRSDDLGLATRSILGHCVRVSGSAPPGVARTGTRFQIVLLEAEDLWKTWLLLRGSSRMTVWPTVRFPLALTSDLMIPYFGPVVAQFIGKVLSPRAESSSSAPHLLPPISLPTAVTRNRTVQAHLVSAYLRSTYPAVDTAVEAMHGLCGFYRRFSRIGVAARLLRLRRQTPVDVKTVDVKLVEV